MQNVTRLQKAFGRANLSYWGGIATIGCASAGFCAYIVPQGLFLDKVVPLFQLYKDGFPVSLSKSLEDKGKQVLEKLDLTPKEKSLVRFFNVYGFDVYCLGTISTKDGACIGIPKTYAYETLDEVIESEIEVKNCSGVRWNSQEGQDLKQSLVLSNKAQKFAIAKEIYCSSYPTLHVNGFSTAFIMISTVQLAKWGNEHFRLFRLPFAVRAAWYTLTSFLGWALWISIKDMSVLYLDGTCDKLAADLGKDYIDGGLEYYSKKMLLNRSLRTLMGSEGEKYYTAHGNYVSFIRTKGLPLSHRVDTFKQWKAEAESVEDVETEDTSSL